MWGWLTTWACVLIAAGPATAQTGSRMTTGVQTHERVQSGAVRLEDLSAAERLEVLRIAEANRTRQRRGTDMGCGPDKERKAMTDLERANWRLKCRR
jgi:hypothetical protein